MPRALVLACWRLVPADDGAKAAAEAKPAVRRRDVERILFVAACLWLVLVLLRGMWDDGKWPAWQLSIAQRKMCWPEGVTIKTIYN